jgi:hypothetical protein
MIKKCSRCGSDEIKSYQFHPRNNKKYINGYECRNCWHREGDNGEPIPKSWYAD